MFTMFTTKNPFPRRSVNNVYVVNMKMAVCTFMEEIYLPNNLNGEG